MRFSQLYNFVNILRQQPTIKSPHNGNNLSFPQFGHLTCDAAAFFKRAISLFLFTLVSKLVSQTVQAKNFLIKVNIFFFKIY
jgi:hypothetical protein